MAEIVDVDDNKKDALSVNITKETFADMVLNFIGKKELLEYNVINMGSFVIDLNGLEDFYYQLEQKLEREERVLLDSFRAVLVYDNDTKRSINGFQKLVDFFENRNVTPIAIQLEWNIILKFKNSPEIENQKVELLFNTNTEDSGISLKVEHTNQIWGMEVLELFKNKIDTIYIKEQKSVSFFRGLVLSLTKGFLSNAFFIVFVVSLTALIFGYIDHKKFNEKKVESLKEIIEKSDNKISSEYIETLVSIYMIEKEYSDIRIPLLYKSKNLKEIMKKYIENMDSEYSEKTSFIFITLFSILVIYFVLYAYSIYYIRYKSSKSFILLTQKSQNEYSEYSEYKDGKKSTQFISITLISFTLLTGLMVNFIWKLVS